MGINQKFRALDGAAKGAGAKADKAHHLATVAAVHVMQLAVAMGYEPLSEPAGEDTVRIRYRRRLPRWLAWVRRLGVCR